MDIEGTLFTDEGIFREDILAFAELLAMGDQRPITIWTGGDMEAARKLVRGVKISYKLVSKHSLRGATVAIAIDDAPQEAFFKDYSISCGNYRKI